MEFGILFFDTLYHQDNVATFRHYRHPTYYRRVIFLSAFPSSEALESVARAASHFEDMMKRDVSTVDTILKSTSIWNL